MEVRDDLPRRFYQPSNPSNPTIQAPREIPIVDLHRSRTDDNGLEVITLVCLPQNKLRDYIVALTPFWSAFLDYKGTKCTWRCKCVRTTTSYIMRWNGFAR